jgi:hypothetical protein
MHTAEIWTVIDRKTKSRLKEARLRSRSITKLLSRSSNLLFGFILITLAATVVHMVYREPSSTSTEAKIKAGYIITDD